MVDAKSRDLRWPAMALLTALLVAGSLLVVSPEPANGAKLSSSKARSAVVKHVKRKWGSSYAVHPACYSLSARKSRCFVHMVHGSKSCTKYATVTLKRGRTRVSMRRPSC